MVNNGAESIGEKVFLTTTVGYSYTTKMILDWYLTLYKKINSKCIMGLNIRAKSLVWKYGSKNYQIGMNKILPPENPGTLKFCLINSTLGKIKAQVTIAEEIITSFYDELGLNLNDENSGKLKGGAWNWTPSFLLAFSHFKWQSHSDGLKKREFTGFKWKAQGWSWFQGYFVMLLNLQVSFHP